MREEDPNVTGMRSMQSRKKKQMNESIERKFIVLYPKILFVSNAIRTQVVCYLLTRVQPNSKN